MFKNRHLSNVFKRLIRQYPVVTVTGPRQSGKTTLCKRLFPDKPYASLESPEIRDRASNDPKQFLAEMAGGIIDEIQRVPQLPSYIQTIVDESGVSGQYILTGSQQFEVIENISQSLAGRSALLTLHPFSYGELYPANSKINLETLLFKGFYPGIYDKRLNPTEAYSFYFRTYIERDVRRLLNVKDLNRFETFVKLCAGRTGQILNLSNLANDCGVQYHTIESWLSVLEAGYIIYLLRPHHRNFGKRLIKSPKLYFLDTGLASYLLGITLPQQLKFHPLWGSIFESFVISELIKQRVHSGMDPNVYFWRDHVGHEIDCIMDFGTSLFPIEIKSSATFTKDLLKNLAFYHKINPDCKQSAIVYGGTGAYQQNETFVAGYKNISVFKGLDYRLEMKV